MTGRLVIALLLAASSMGCLSARDGQRPPDEQFGHRVEGRDEEGRETLVIVPPDEDLSYRTYPATFETVTVRPSPPEPDGSGMVVEILVKGAFPDACTELHDVRQERSGNLVRVELDMRRPEGAMCATVLRPYRFYLTLDGRYRPGPYSLTLNGMSHPFELREPR